MKWQLKTVRKLLNGKEKKDIKGEGAAVLLKYAREYLLSKEQR